MVSERALRDPDPVGAIRYWNAHYDKLVAEYGGKYVMFLPSEHEGTLFDVFSDDDPHKLRRFAEERGYMCPLIDLVPTGNEIEL